ncbi:MAG: DUF1656 domain-containing protein [Verrucomicrobia bacterium]|nr:DUF1656 domain-containing protein [Verrucomicrobiota bacterium]
MHEISIGGVLVSPLLPCFFLTIPLFWAIDKVSTVAALRLESLDARRSSRRELRDRCRRG